MNLFHAPLFAVDGVWTTKEVLMIVGSTLGLLVPVAWGIVKLITRQDRARLRRLDSERKQLKADLDERDRVIIPGLQHKLSVVQEAKIDVERRAAVLQVKGDEGDVAKRQLNEVSDELEAERRRIARALRRDGAIWSERVLQSTCVEFKKLDPEIRRMPIISVLNLKGGVGKTTATANLGAALAARGYRVLLLDLDLQGSLTNLLMSETDQERAFNENRLIGDFLDAAFDSEHPNLNDYIIPVCGFESESKLVPTTDVQAYAEMNLSVRWFLRDSNRDPRFLLRKELHLKRVCNSFDIVLIDCPPLINVSCVNALAASDFVLIPVMPSAQSTTRVPVLLQRLRTFHDNINTDLNVLGVFGNRTRGAELTADEKSKFDLLRRNCDEAFGKVVPVFETLIRNSADIRAVEDDRRTLCRDDDMFEAFEHLACEVESHMPLFCRPVSTARARSEAKR